MRKSLWLVVILFVVFLTGCRAGATPVPPTTTGPDVPAISTQAVATAFVRLTLAAALNPTPSVEPTQTLTPEPGASPVPTDTATPMPGETETPALNPTPTLLLPSPTLIPTSSLTPLPGGPIPYFPTPTGHSPGDQATLISYSPADWSVYNAGRTFYATWTLKNTGSNTWPTTYYLRFSRGDDMGEADIYYLGSPVEPGHSVALTVPIQAPSKAGKYLGYYQFVNDNANIIYQVYIAIEVR